MKAESAISACFALTLEKIRDIKARYTGQVRLPSQNLKPSFTVTINYLTHFNILKLSLSPLF